MTPWPPLGVRCGERVGAGRPASRANLSRGGESSRMLVPSDLGVMGLLHQNSWGHQVTLKDRLLQCVSLVRLLLTELAR